MCCSSMDHYTDAVGHILPATPLLVRQVEDIQPDGFTPKIVKQTDDYLYAEFESPTFGVRKAAPLFVDKECSQPLSAKSIVITFFR